MIATYISEDLRNETTGQYRDPQVKLELSFPQFHAIMRLVYRDLEREDRTEHEDSMNADLLQFDELLDDMLKNGMLP